MKSVRQLAPHRIRRLTDLAIFQRQMFRAITQPPRRESPSPLTNFAIRFVKPTRRLMPVDRLEIYRQIYWNRLTRCLQDHCPALFALLRPRKFTALAHAYIEHRPSRSFTPRHLAGGLADFILQHPRLTAPQSGLAHAIARFEWAQAAAFDGGLRSPLSPREVRRALHRDLRATLQPHTSLLALKWPADKFVAAVNASSGIRDAASHTVIAAAPRPANRVPRPRRQKVWLAIHRQDSGIFCKRISAVEFAALEAIAAGVSPARALSRAGAHVAPTQVARWVTDWVELGWLCRRRRSARG
jgi:hypothetical protein